MTPNAKPDGSALPARVVGGLIALIGMGLAILSASGVTQIAQSRLLSGFSILLGVLGVRLLVGSLGEEFSLRSARRIRLRYRSRVVDFLSRPRPTSEGARSDLASAIEDVAAMPDLDALATSARVGLLGIALVWWAAGALSAGIVIVLLGVAAPLYRRAGLRSAEIDADYRARRSTLESRQLELIRHAPELRALGAVEFGAAEIAAISDSEHSIIERAVRVSLGSSLVTEFLGGVSVGLVAMLVGFALLGGHISLYRGLIAVLITSEVFVHVRRYGTAFHRRENAELASKVLVAHESSTTTSGPLITCDDLRTLSGVGPVSLSLEKGDRLLITGPSGAGKTTLLHTLIGWRDAVEGTLERREGALGFVSPESPLVSDSIWQNVTCAAALEESTVRNTLDSLGLSGSRFADLSQPVGVDARGLSSGERVRLVLARALLAHCAVLVLDDVAGVLDEENRQRIRDVLARLNDVAIIEATVDTPLVAATREIRL